MKVRSFRKFCAAAVSLLLANSLGCPRAFAAWNSIRANNRSPAEVRNTQRAFQPAPNQARGSDQGRGSERRAKVPRSTDVRREGEHGVISRPHEGIERERREHRRFEFEEERHDLYPWSHYHPGYVIGTLPYGYVPLNVGGTPYYYYGGSYYETGPSGYVVVQPPVGAVVPDLPPGAETVAAGPSVFYYAGGAFYAPNIQGGFVVIAPPLGVTVDTLPPGATPVSINGMIYYQADGAYFIPMMQNGVTVYTTVQP